MYVCGWKTGKISKNDLSGVLLLSLDFPYMVEQVKLKKWGVKIDIFYTGLIYSVLD